MSGEITQPEEFNLEQLEAELEASETVTGQLQLYASGLFVLASFCALAHDHPTSSPATREMAEKMQEVLLKQMPPEMEHCRKYAVYLMKKAQGGEAA